MNDTKNKIIIALDVSDTQEIDRLFSVFSGHIKTIKIGKQLFTRYGPEIVRRAKEKGFEVFLDLKFHDIPNTVKKAVTEAVLHGVTMLTIHISGGKAMLAAAREGAQNASLETGIPQPLLLGVTVLTSINKTILNNEIGISGDIVTTVKRFSNLADNVGLDGVIASPYEITPVKEQCGNTFLVITPGIRPVWAQKGDQKRVMTPGEAVKLGADYLVIGRAITAQPDPVKAFYKIVDEIG